MVVKVALAGATGNLGPAILKELLDAGFDVTILSRKGSNTSNTLPAHSNQKVVKVDYTSVDDLTSALAGISVVVSTLAGAALETQKPLIDASVAAGVKRFIPSEFGSDLDQPGNQALPVFRGKVKAQEYLKSLAKTDPKFTYTFIYNNLFFDWGMSVGFFVNLKEHKMTVYDGGEHPVSFTTLASVGKGVVGVIKNQEATKNRAVYIHDVVFSQKQLIDFIKEIDGKDWTTEEKSTKELADDAYSELQKPDPNYGKAMLEFLPRAAFGKDRNPDYTGRVDNKLFGMPENDFEYIKNVVKGLL